MGLLDRLAVHAGLGVKLEGGDGDERSGDQGDKGRSVAVEREHREQQGGQEEQGEQGDGWGGRSGLWWIAREEARRGQLVPALDEDGEEREGDEQQGPGGMDGGLGWHHDQVITVTFADWHAAGQLAAEAGVQAQPSPLLTARLKARALESLCRLCRGEGLGGAYAPAQECDRVLIRVGVLRVQVQTAMQCRCTPVRHTRGERAARTAACAARWPQAYSPPHGLPRSKFEIRHIPAL